jgi:hypothetical protein
LPIEMGAHLYEMKRWLAREPERSRRVIRLVFANWLAQVKKPDPGEQKPALRARLHFSGRTANVLFYPVGPESPANSRVLSPREVSEWLFTIHDARQFFEQSYLPTVRLTEQRGYRDLVVLLAGELYRRGRGTRPASDEALVGTYLKSLPDDGTAGLDDGTIPTISNQDDSALPWPG